MTFDREISCRFSRRLFNTINSRLVDVSSFYMKALERQETFAHTLRVAIPAHSLHPFPPSCYADSWIRKNYALQLSVIRCITRHGYSYLVFARVDCRKTLVKCSEKAQNYRKKIFHCFGLHFLTELSDQTLVEHNKYLSTFELRIDYLLAVRPTTERRDKGRA